LRRRGRILESHGQLQAGGQIDLITTDAIEIVQQQDGFHPNPKIPPSKHIGSEVDDAGTGTEGSAQSRGDPAKEIGSRHPRSYAGIKHCGNRFNANDIVNI